MQNDLKLLVFNQDQFVQEYQPVQDQVVIGREPDNDLVINYPQISRKHLRLFRSGKFWMVENLSQSNPVMLRGVPVLTPTVLQPDDRLILGTSYSIQAVFITPAIETAYQPASPQNPVYPVYPPEQVAQGYNNYPNQGYNIPAPNYPANYNAAPPQAPVYPASANVYGAAGGTIIMDTVPPTLSLTYTEDLHEFNKEFVLNKPKMTIGRIPENDIVIPVTTVSRTHAILTSTPGGYIITDQNSANGLLYGGGKVQERLLVDGDVIRIGDETGNLATLTYHDQSRPAISQALALRLEPGMQVITIGRAADNALILNYPQISAHHAVIRREPNGTFIQDLGSTNGTFVRGERLASGASATITPGESIQLASYQLVYQQDAIAHVNLDKVRIDAMHLRKVVNNGLVLLNDISLTVQPKEFVALVGGSGAGKTTLLDAINGFRPANEGAVLINGDDYYRNFALYRSSIGYVPQDDIIHRELTVERALYYVARLRLPSDTTDAEIEQRVVEVLNDVEMTHRRKVVVSRLSGGQRKRISIAVELLAKPKLLFLDEPTSGLDPGLDKRMMFLLRRLADQGRTILLVTHATSNITACDKVVFMGPGGKLCFYGSPRQALDFFDVKEFPDIYTKIEQTPTSPEEWEARFRQSSYFQELVVEPQTQIPQPQNQPYYNQAPGYNNQFRDIPTRAPGTMSDWQQFKILTRRYYELMSRDRINLMVLILQAPIIAIILALVAGQSIFDDGHPFTTAQQVMLMLAISGVWLGTNNAAREITKENQVYMRERLVNLRVFPYIMSKVAVLAILSLLQSFLLVSIISIFAGVPPKGAIFPAYTELVFEVWLTCMVGCGMGLLVSAFASNTDKAVSIVPIVLIPQIILSGVIFELPGATKTLSYVTATKWSLDSLGTTGDLNRLYFRGQIPPEEACSPDKGIYDPRNYAGNPCQLNDNGSLGQRAGHIFLRWSVLIMMAALFIGGSCYLQKRKDRAWTRR